MGVARKAIPKTLPEAEMKAQTIFNKVVKHLFAQGCAASLPRNPKDGAAYSGCAYRGPNGTTCAVGHLIPDRLYDPVMEGKSYSQIAEVANRDNRKRGVCSKALNKPPLFKKCEAIVERLGAENTALLTDLQCVHDDLAMAEPKGWGRTQRGMRNLRGRLLRVAAEYKLKTTHCPELSA